LEFDEYVAARGTALLRFARVLTGDSASAEDLLQAALADAYVRWSRVEAADAPDAYVRRVIVNRHLSSSAGD
jgi:DNA-directed RNA polymerase specialized sigma24 family protein